MRVPIRKGDSRIFTKPDPYLTEAKFLQMKKKLEHLRMQHPALAAEVKRLAEMGDFSENAAYQLAKGRLRGLNQRIIDLENHLKVAEIIKTDPHLLSIQIGSRVVLEKDGQQKIYTILGSSESDPLNNVISYSSPLGAALIGHVVDDKISLILAGKKIEYVVKKVEQL